MTDDNHTTVPGASKRAHAVMRNLAWVAVGILLTIFLLVDPLGLHSIDTWLAKTPTQSEPVADSRERAGDREILFYRNPMNPAVTAPVPMKDEMGMDYIPVYADSAAAAGSEHGRPPEREILFYRNPMDPTITSPMPMQDEMGMDYVPVYAPASESTEAAGSTVVIDSGVVQNMNVQVVPIERRDLSHVIRSVGYLEYDQERMVTVTTKYNGFIENVYVNYIGEPVRKGEPLFDIYSPELVQTEQELLSSLEFARRLEAAPEDSRRRAEALVAAARTRLGYWDISTQQIEQLEATGQVFRTLTVAAPSNGVVMKRMAGLEGMAASPGMEIFHIADLSSMWLSVELFETQVAWVDEGLPADVNLTYFPGETFRATVRFVEPAFSEKTRTLRVTLDVPNSDGRLRSGMFATVVFEPIAVKQALTVPTMAVLRTGQRNVVIVQTAPGRFVPRDVRLGHETQGYVEILEGVDENEEVVTSAQFLLDSESRLQEAIQKMISAQRNGPGS